MIASTGSSAMNTGMPLTCTARSTANGAADVEQRHLGEAPHARAATLSCGTDSVPPAHKDVVDSAATAFCISACCLFPGEPAALDLAARWSSAECSGS